MGSKKAFKESAEGQAHDQTSKNEETVKNKTAFIEWYRAQNGGKKMSRREKELRKFITYLVDRKRLHFPYNPQEILDRHEEHILDM